LRGCSTSVRINIDLRELYKRLSKECRKQLLQYIREKLDEAMLEQMLMGGSEEKKEGGGEERS
jgi:predicted DNA-binding protein